MVAQDEQGEKAAPRTQRRKTGDNPGPHGHGELEVVASQRPFGILVPGDCSIPLAAGSSPVLPCLKSSRQLVGCSPLSAEPCSSSRPRKHSELLSSLFLLQKKGLKKKKTRTHTTKPRRKPFVAIFKPQPHQQYALQLSPPSTQPAIAQPIINGPYRRRKGPRITGSCCLIRPRRLRTRPSSFSSRRLQSPGSTCCLLLRYSRLCSSPGSFLAFVVCQS